MNVLFSIVITLTVLGKTTDYPLLEYYDREDCEAMTLIMIKTMEPREGVDASIQCVQGWRI